MGPGASQFRGGYSYGSINSSLGRPRSIERIHNAQIKSDATVSAWLGNNPGRDSYWIFVFILPVIGGISVA